MWRLTKEVASLLRVSKLQTQGGQFHGPCPFQGLARGHPLWLELLM